MKKFLYGLLLILGASSASAQIRFGLEADLQLSNQTQNIDNPTYGASKVLGDVRPGIRTGFLLDAVLGRHFSLQPALYFSQKGFFDPGSTLRLRLNYLELPFNLVAKGRIGRGDLFLGGGPYAAIALDGKAGDGTRSQDLTFGKNGDLKLWDGGLNLVFGYQSRQGLFVRGYASRSVTDIAPNGARALGVAVYNTAYGFGLGYLF